MKLWVQIVTSHDLGAIRRQFRQCRIRHSAHPEPPPPDVGGGANVVDVFELTTSVMMRPLPGPVLLAH